MSYHDIRQRIEEKLGELQAAAPGCAKIIQSIISDVADMFKSGFAEKQNSREHVIPDYSSCGDTIEAIQLYMDVNKVSGKEMCKLSGMSWPTWRKVSAGGSCYPGTALRLKESFGIPERLLKIKIKRPPAIPGKPEVKPEVKLKSRLTDDGSWISARKELNKLNLPSQQG